MKSVGRDSVEPKLDFLGKSHGSTESRPTVTGSEVERAEPDSEHHCSPVLRSDVVTARLREGYGGQAGDSERRRDGAQRRPPPPLGLSKAHIPARQRKGSVTCYREASLIQVRLRPGMASIQKKECSKSVQFLAFGGWHRPFLPPRKTVVGGGSGACIRG